MIDFSTIYFIKPFYKIIDTVIDLSIARDLYKIFLNTYIIIICLIFKNFFSLHLFSNVKHVEKKMCID